MKLLSGIIIILAQFIFLNPAYSVDIKDKSSFLLDIRNKDNSIYLNRLSVSKNISKYDIKTSIFGEFQWHFGTSKWDKITSGIEAKKYLLKYFYCGESVHFISGQMLDYMTFDPGNMSVEATTKLGLNFPLTKKLSFKIRNEYSYNLEKGAAGLNEVFIDIPYEFNENLDFAIGWRHTDRIHAFDSDYATTSIILHF
ncbi:MAG: hypothetical protein CO035_07685 [Candidatus Omnitrophica bacterium CG_4_9_14_0_2_um_filter_42_8]|nr:MAG: hypothetical protein COW92_01850 [Candidatus Omnitrophica bacterium CG22_combo_CG10-13_8_21_14_all_43_16]PJC47070.1 MAG: hypothetical protein CO035_07685 [Candidatus Omnitrophica bacterium CG_4_9_14_0_2_um_filter_42_8]